MKSSIQRVWGMIIRHLFVWPREIEAIAEAFWWPSFDLFLWGLMTVYIQKTQNVPSVFISFFLGAIILWMFVYRSQQEMGFTFLREAWDRNILNIFTTPLTIWEFVSSTLILGMIKLAISAIWMVFLGYILFSFNVFSFGWYLIPFVINLLVTGWSAGFIINGLILRYGYRVQAFAWTLVLIIQPFSAVFYPVSVLPSWMQPVAYALPTSYIFEGMRKVLSEGVMDNSFVVIASILNLLYLTLSIMLFKNFFRGAQKSGAIVKFS